MLIPYRNDGVGDVIIITLFVIYLAKCLDFLLTTWYISYVEYENE